MLQQFHLRPSGSFVRRGSILVPLDLNSHETGFFGQCATLFMAAVHTRGRLLRFPRDPWAEPLPVKSHHYFLFCVNITDLCKHCGLNMRSMFASLFSVRHFSGVSVGSGYTFVLMTDRVPTIVIKHLFNHIQNISITHAPPVFGDA